MVETPSVASENPFVSRFMPQRQRLVIGVLATGFMPDRDEEVPDEDSLECFKIGITLTKAVEKPCLIFSGVNTHHRTGRTIASFMRAEADKLPLVCRKDHFNSLMVHATEHPENPLWSDAYPRDYLNQIFDPILRFGFMGESVVLVVPPKMTSSVREHVESMGMNDDRVLSFVRKVIIIPSS